MGKRGPRPKPTNLRLLHGDRSDRINHDEPMPEQGPPECPPDASAEVREVWDYALDQLIVMGVATKADRDALRCFCEAVVTHRKASVLLANSPLLIKGHRNVLTRNPLLVVQRDAAAVIRAYAHEFGFTPSARSEIRKGGSERDEQPAARYLNA